MQPARNSVPKSYWPTIQEFLDKRQTPIDDSFKNIQNQALLGKGHFGCVYKANATTAVKVLQENLVHDVRPWQYFLKEFLLWKFISDKLDDFEPCHNNHIAKCYGLTKYEIPTSPFIFVGLSMKLYTGNLTDHIKTLKYKNIFDSKMVLKIIVDMVNGVSTLHSLNIIHNDIAKRNFLVDEKDNVVITDFGLAKKRPKVYGRRPSLAFATSRRSSRVSSSSNLVETQRKDRGTSESSLPPAGLHQQVSVTTQKTVPAVFIGRCRSQERNNMESDEIKPECIHEKLSNRRKSVPIAIPRRDSIDILIEKMDENLDLDKIYSCDCENYYSCYYLEPNPQDQPIWWCAPEVLKNAANNEALKTSSSTDLYMFGCTIAEIISIKDKYIPFTYDKNEFCNLLDYSSQHSFKKCLALKTKGNLNFDLNEVDPLLESPGLFVKLINNLTEPSKNFRLKFDVILIQLEEYGRSLKLKERHVACHTICKNTQQHSIEIKNNENTTKCIPVPIPRKRVSKYSTVHELRKLSEIIEVGSSNDQDIGYNKLISSSYNRQGKNFVKYFKGKMNENPLERSESMSSCNSLDSVGNKHKEGSRRRTSLQMDKCNSIREVAGSKHRSVHQDIDS